ncbi:MAG: OmpA/MotB family protein, partial [Sulfobacillus sp.]
TGLSGVAASSTAELQSLNQLQNRIEAALVKAHVANQVSVTSNERGVEVSLNATLLFTPGSAVLSAQATGLIELIGQALASVPNDVEVVGYTDSTPIRTALYPSNWQLSAMRAANVVYVLAKVPGINPSRLSLSGFGRYHPIASNATASGRQLNRRVNILVLRSNVATVAIGSGP